MSSPIAQSDAPARSTKQWCDDHDLIWELVPFAGRATDPFEVGRELRETFESARDTTATVSVDAHATPILDFHILVNGSWRLDTSQRLFVNPHYKHLEAFERGITTDREQRDTELRKAAGSGLVMRDELAPRFGIEPESVTDCCQRHGLSWEDERRRGRRRLARTCQLALDWGYSHQEIGDALPRPNRTIQNWIYTHGDLENPPADPTAGGERR